MSNHEMMSTLKSELAALQFKRDRLVSEVSNRAPRNSFVPSVIPIKIPESKNNLLLFVASRHQRSTEIQGPEDGRTRSRDGIVERTASQTKFDHCQFEKQNKSIV